MSISIETINRLHEFSFTIDFNPYRFGKVDFKVSNGIDFLARELKGKFIVSIIQGLNEKVIPWKNRTLLYWELSKFNGKILLHCRDSKGKLITYYQCKQKYKFPLDRLSLVYHSGRLMLQREY